MSTYEHDLLTARFAALAPQALPGDWDDVLERAGAVRPRHRGVARSLWRGGRRRKLVVALAVAVLVAAVAASAYGTARVLFLDKGFIGLPPVGATPSAPKSGELVLHFQGRSGTHEKGPFIAPFVHVWVYADGRLIWEREGQVPEGANELTSGYLEQRLTPEGAELLRSEVLGLFDRSRTRLETVPADDDPRPGPFGGVALFVSGDAGVHGGSVEVRDGDRLVRLHWQDIGAEKGSKRFDEILDDLRERFDGTIATPRQLSALRRIDTLLTDPASVLPASAWAVREVRAYVPSHYAVCISTSPPKDVSQLLSLLPTRAADALRDKSRTRLDGEVVEAREAGRTVVLGQSVTYCSKLTTEEARWVANAVSGLPRHIWPLALMYVVAGAVDNLNPTTISFDPYFPHGQFLLYGGGR
jgi:hypothetical protein